MGCNTLNHKVVMDTQQASCAITDALIPGLLDDLSLLSLACLPARLHPKASFVSRAWQCAFQSQALHALRLKCGSLKTWVLLFFSFPPSCSISCWVIDSLGIHSHPLHFSAPNLSYRHHTEASATAARGEVLIVDDQPPCRYDVLHRGWLHPFAPPMLTTRHFGTTYAVLDGYVYADGGSILDTSAPLPHTLAIKSVERLDCKNMSLWERLPDMHMARTRAAALALHGCFYVIGGYGDGERHVVHSAEIWDPRCQEWTLVPELYPSHIFDKTMPADGLVTTLMGCLFAICNYQVMRYDHATKQWTCLGDIPVDMLHRTREHLAYNFNVLGVGHALWLVALPEYSDEEEVEDVDICILACIPCSGGSLIWRRLPYSFGHSVMYHLGFPVVV